MSEPCRNRCYPPIAIYRLSLPTVFQFAESPLLMNRSVGIGTVFPYRSYVANQGSNDVFGFAINAGSRALTTVGGSPFFVGVTPRAIATPEHS